MSPRVIAGLLALATACAEPGAPQVETAASPVVYGTDNRTDYYASNDELFKRITRESIVALIPSDRLDESNPNDIRLRTDTLGRSHGLCTDQRFRDDPTAASCSGTLIDTDLVLTAGHCVSSLNSCRSFRFVFDYYFEADGQLAPIQAEDVYRCRQVVVAQSRGQVDFGVVQLDRPVTGGHRPAPLVAGDVPLVRGSSVAVVGFGSGIPAKIDTGGAVLDPRSSELDYFLASTDTFEGNSGSGVFNLSGEVVGILVRGERDYVQRGSCTAVNVISSGGGEGVTYVARALEGMCPVWKTDLCGDTGGVCRACADDSACPAGWTCARAALDPGVTWCAAPCSAGCAPGHVCDNGRCAPDVEQRCLSGDVWDFDVCGRQVGVSEDCGARICDNGMCTDGAPGNSCSVAESIPLVDSTLEGQLGEQFSGGYTGSCARTNSGRDRVWSFDVDRLTDVVIEATGFDTVLYLRSDCEDPSSEVACSDDDTPPGNRGSHIEGSLVPGRYYLFLDSFGTRTRTYRVTISATPIAPPPPDAGVEPDVGFAEDAGFAADAETPDAGSTPINKSIETVEPEEGCGCASAEPGSAPWILGALALLLLRRRR